MKKCNLTTHEIINNDNKCMKKCKPNKTRNTNNRCVKPCNLTIRELLKNKCVNKCKPNKTRNKNNRCVLNKSIKKNSKELVKYVAPIKNYQNTGIYNFNHNNFYRRGFL